MAYIVQAKIASRGYYHYKNVNWEIAKAGEKVTIGIETNNESIKIDAYWSHSQKSTTFRLDKSAKNVKMGPKTEKNLFSLLNSLPFKYVTVTFVTFHF